MNRTLLLPALGLLALSATALAAAQSQHTDDEIVIKAQGHPHYMDFQSKLNKSAALRTAVAKKGLDVAFTEWMRQDHPYVYATTCVKMAHDKAPEVKAMPHMADFQSILPKRSDLKAEVARKGLDAAFLDWLKKEHPGDYAAHAKLAAVVGSGLSGPYAQEFLSVLEKRSDLRTAVAKRGTLAVYAEWLRREHPDAGKEPAKR